jgi:hypothetical protein
MPNSVRRSFSLLAVAGLVAMYAGCSNPTGPGTVSGAWNANCGSASSAWYRVDAQRIG